MIGIDRADRRLFEQFGKDGFVALPGFLSQSEIAELRENLARFIEVVVPTMPREEVFYENKNDSATLKQLQRMFEHDSYFHDLMIGSRFERMAAALLKNQVRPINMQYFNKQPIFGKPTPPHQDGYYFMLEPNEAVTMWLALDPADEENGCIRYIRGSHLRGLRPHGRTKTLGFSQGLLDFGNDQDVRNEVALSALPGDLLVHHALTIHRADGNNSRHRPRQALGLIYYSADAKESEEKSERHAALLEELRSRGQV